MDLLITVIVLTAILITHLQLRAKRIELRLYSLTSEISAYRRTIKNYTWDYFADETQLPTRAEFLRINEGRIAA